MSRSARNRLKPLEVVGGGRMGTALAAGLLAAGRLRAQDVFIVEPDSARASALASELPGATVVADHADLGANTPGDALLAVKPQHAEAACKAIARGPRVPRRILSVVAGLRIETIASWVGDQTVIVRAMPNTPALVGAGASAIAGGPGVGEHDVWWAENLLGSVGKVVRVGEESLDAVTGLSGSGPAYFFLVVEALVEAGVREGLSRQVSEELASATLYGAGMMMERTRKPATALRMDVTSPGGTTAEALRVLEARAVRSAFIEAVAVAAERSRNLGC